MCLAVPLKLASISADGREGTVLMGQAATVIGLELTPEARPGDFVLVHAGMAIAVIEPEEARETIAAFREYARVPGLFAPAGEENGPDPL